MRPFLFKIAAFLKPKRRWLQFSLRTLFIVMTVFAVCLAVIENRVRKERRAIVALAQLGGSVWGNHEATCQVSSTRLAAHMWDTKWTYRRPGAPIPGPAWLRQWIGQEYFVPTAGVDLTQTPVTDAGLEILKNLPSLRCALLNNTQITDAGLQHLRDLSRLEALDIRDTHVTDTGLKFLGELPGLQALVLQGTNVTDAGLWHIARSRKLKWLDVTDTRVSKEGVKEIRRRLPKCLIID